MPSRRGAVVVAAFIIAAVASAVATRTGVDVRDGFAGRYESSFKELTGSVDLIRLACRDDRHCARTMTTSATGFRDPPRELDDVRPVGVFDANFALRHAVAHRDTPALPSETAIAARLASVSRSSPEAITCRDLDAAHAPGTFEACRLRAADHDDPRMFLFFVKRLTCGPRTCRFDIIPLDEQRLNAAHAAP